MKSWWARLRRAVAEWLPEVDRQLHRVESEAQLRPAPEASAEASPSRHPEGLHVSARATDAHANAGMVAATVLDTPRGHHSAFPGLSPSLTPSATHPPGRDVERTHPSGTMRITPSVRGPRPETNGAAPYPSAFWSRGDYTDSRQAPLSFLQRELPNLKDSTHFLLQREQEMRTLVENCPIPLVRYHRDGRRIYANAAHASTTGIPHLAGIGKTPRELGVFDEAMLVQYELAFEHVVRARQPRTLTIRLHRDTPCHRTLRIQMVPECNERDEVVSVLAIAHDFAEPENERDEEEARGEQFFRAMLDSAPCFIARHDHELRCVYGNAALFAHFGEQAINADAAYDACLIEPVNYRALLQRAMDEQSRTVIYAHWRRADGTSQSGPIWIGPVPPNGDQPGFLLAIGQATPSSREQEEASVSDVSATAI